MTERLYYFAYGSNLLMEQMVQRCPQSLPFSRGILRNYRLVYKANPSGRGVADIIPSKGNKVYGSVYEVTQEDLKKLDKYEGRPKVYDRHFIEIETNQGMVKCVVYLMQPGYEFQLPNVDYFKKIFNGYEDWSLPQIHLKDEYLNFKNEFKLLPPVKKKSELNNNNKYKWSGNASTYNKRKGKSGKKGKGKNRNSKPVYKTRTPIGYEPAIKWV